MAYSVPITQVAGTPILSADWNTYVRDNILFLANPPACRATHNTTQSLTDNVEASVTFNTESYDTDGMFAGGAPTRITFATAGIYTVKFGGEVVAAADYASYYVYPRLNGTTQIGVGTSTPALVGSVGLWLAFSIDYKFAAADYVEARINQNNTTSAARNLVAGVAMTATWKGFG